jgi:hypothetical protein
VVIHQLAASPVDAFHDLSTCVDSLWTRPPNAANPALQPPIANISILGSFEVAAERSSE